MNEDLAYAVGRAYSDFVMPETVVVGHDNRSSSPMLSQALVAGLIASGVQVHHLGTCGTEEVYFSTAHFKFDGGIMVTASHNPKDYNGMKLVEREARPISADTGLNTIRDAVQHNRFAQSNICYQSNKGACTKGWMYSLGTQARLHTAATRPCRPGLLEAAPPAGQSWAWLCGCDNRLFVAASAGDVCAASF